MFPNRNAEKDKTVRIFDAKIKLFALDNKHIEVDIIKKVEIKKTSDTIIYKDSVVSKDILKGKFKDGYFSINRTFNYFGFPFLYLNIYESKSLIGLDIDNQSIIVKYGESHFANILFFAGGAKGYTVMRFNKNK